MSWLDIVILIIAAIATFLGLRAGLIGVALSLAGLIAGTILAGRYSIPLSERLSFIPQTSLAEGVAFAIIVTGTLIVAGILAKLLTRMISAIMLGWVNRLGGAIFGLISGAILCGVLLAIWSNVFGKTEVISQSSLATFLLDRLATILPLLPVELNAIGSFFG